MRDYSKAAGILSIVAGVCSLFQIIMVFFSVRLFNSDLFMGPGAPAEFFFFMQIFYIGWGIFLAIAGALAITGGVFALKAKYWGWALAGAIAGTVSFFPSGVAAVILTVMAREEFYKTQTSPAANVPSP